MKQLIEYLKDFEGSIDFKVVEAELNELLRNATEHLEKRDAILSALEVGGVDNWTWYSESLEQAGLLDD